MLRLIYHLGILVYRWAIGVSSIFNPKARLWISGRWGWEDKLREGIGTGGDWIWIHCASLGEFEQGRPVIEALKREHPQFRILLTFFSPSGYEVRKGYPHADFISYLPLDRVGNARAFLDIVKPRMAILVKYDLWLNFLFETHRRKIPLVLVSALVRPNSKFLKSFLKDEYRRAFRCFSWIFTQDSETKQLLEHFSGNPRISVAGDTRFDRVAELLHQPRPLPAIEEWVRGRKVIVAGSVWPEDERVLLPVIERLRRENLCWIVAPHEIHPAHIDSIIARDQARMAKYSRLPEVAAVSDVLWIDNVGMLSRIYQYSEMVYIGGGFGVGIHNTQEPAVYGNPVIFGPNHENFQEAVDMVKSGGAVSILTLEELERALLAWLDNPGLLSHVREENKQYMQSRTGATDAILTKLKFLHFLDERADLSEDRS
ncbi:MAG: glycosyltransferase N-terminal domain-containing protein [Bacteroidia bacterium]